MKKLIMFGSGGVVILVCFIYCLPYSNSIEIINDFIELAILGSVINYSIYIISLYLSKKNKLNSLIEKTNGLIMGIPYVFVFFNALYCITYLIALISTKTFALTGSVILLITSIDSLSRIKKL
jgi:uncharacterized membrane protein